jgi:hypothetical protein
LPVFICKFFQAVLCHLEVRWQLFSEALAKFGDLEAMLAVCTGKVVFLQPITALYLS